MSKKIIEQAIRENRSLYFTYTKYSGERSNRNVSNINYSNKYGEYGYYKDHIKGYCQLRNEERTFRISRMSNVSLTSPKSTTYSGTRSTQVKQNEGCYIATMVYGNYNHPKVFILRNYRDRVLKNKWWGPAFIKFYYLVSPSMVKSFEKSKTINTIVRRFLNHIISYLKNS